MIIGVCINVHIVYLCVCELWLCAYIMLMCVYIILNESSQASKIPGLLDLGLSLRL